MNLPFALKKRTKKKLELLVTLWPSFPHFPRFSRDERLSAVRLNSAAISNPELDVALSLLKDERKTIPLYFDFKGRQLRITEVRENPQYLDITINHPISVKTPTVVLFKAGADWAMLDRVVENGKRLIFQGGPEWMVRAGDSFHIRDKSLQVGGPQFTDEEIAKIQKVREFGFQRYFLSYVQCQKDVDEFRELVGRDAQVWLKIEDRKGLNYVATEFRKIPELVLVAAQGDMYVEIGKPHEILGALKLLIGKDPEACAASRMLLSIMKPVLMDKDRNLEIENLKEIFESLKMIQEDRDAGRILLSILKDPVPSCADFEQLGWLYEIGYRRMMLCDELCLKEELLATAINAFQAFRETMEG